MRTSAPMRRLFAVTAVAAALIWPDASTSAAGESAIRVACVGDSITAGVGLRNVQADSYPVQLGKLLGSRYEVRNFGHSGATMVKVSYRPYWDVPEFRAATAFKPNIVIIQLGTNDSDPAIWVAQEQRGNFRADCNAMIDHFLGPETKPLVYLCLPAPIRPGKADDRRRILREEVTGIIQDIVRKRNLPVIDLYEPLEGKPELFPDYFHPNADGAKIIANAVCGAITGRDSRHGPFWAAGK
jgi:lysophospholipase L1-like esterase